MAQVEEANIAVVSSTSIVLPDFYYLDNFISLVKSVVALYDDLLSVEELAFVEKFSALTRHAQALFVRMLMRKGQNFRVSKIHYQEISDTQSALNELKAVGLVEFPASLACVDLFPLFTKAEWLRYFNKPKSSALKKVQLLTELERENQDNLAIILAKKFNDPIVKLCDTQLFDTYKLLYFGNGRQDLTEFILRDIGIQRFEPYTLDRQTRFFNDRSSIDQMLSYYQLLDLAENIGDWSAEKLVSYYKSLPSSPPLVDSNTGAQRALFRRIQRLKIVIARQLERLSEWNQAFEIYIDCDMPPSRERRARVLEKLKYYSLARELCEQLLIDGSDAEQEFAGPFLLKLTKKMGESCLANPRFIPAESVLNLEYRSEVKVEAATANYFSDTGQCFYVENHLFLSLFGVVFWPAIFANVSGAFTHPFQFAPHDINDPEFQSRRESIIQKCWCDLSHWIGDVSKVLRFAQKKVGVVNAFVRWDILQETLLEQAFKNIPESHFALIFERIWKNIKENRNGFPDLVYFPEKGGYELIEVKGPGDRLQKNQLRWLAYFEKHNIPSRVAYVQWRD